jgi:predicted RNA-binding Zn ribbon-like protein
MKSTIARTAHDAEDLILGFLNTVEDDGKTRRQNSFQTPGDLLRLLQPFGLCGDDAPPSGSQMRAILALREAGYAVVSAMAANRRPGREESLHLEMVMKSVLQDARFSFGKSGLALTPGPLGGLHDHLALAFVAMLQTADLSRLRECRRCTHLFMDHGRGRGRRWCSMARCGNRAKAQAFRVRQRALNG